MSTASRIEKLKALIACHQDFPKPGILFRDMLPILRDPYAFDDLICLLVERIKSKSEVPDVIVGLEARGFLLAPIVALKLGIGFVPVRKTGKLPGKTDQVCYELEYGKDSFEIQTDSIKPGQKVIIIDDLIALGGTMEAGCRLVRKLSATVIECIAVIELIDLNGRNRFDASFYSLIQF